MKRLVFIFVVSVLVTYTLAASYDEMFQSYFALQNSLASDSLKGAIEAAKKLQTEVPTKGRNQKITEQLSTIRALAASLATAKTLDQARKPFGDMSALMIALKAETKIPANEFYCPMVKKGWLQKGDQVQNPYLGKEMLSCGEKKKS